MLRLGSGSVRQKWTRNFPTPGSISEAATREGTTHGVSRLDVLRFDQVTRIMRPHGVSF